MAIFDKFKGKADKSRTKSANSDTKAADKKGSKRPAKSENKTANPEVKQKGKTKQKQRAKPDAEPDKKKGSLLDVLKGLFSKSKKKSSEKVDADGETGEKTKDAARGAKKSGKKGALTREDKSALRKLKKKAKHDAKMLSGPQKAKLDVSKRFELAGQAASGTMSKFRVAREILTGNNVGIKFIDVEKKKHFENRFKGLKKPPEGEIGLKVKHPRIVETFEYGTTTNNEPYILMEYIPGAGLSSLINENSPLLEGKRLMLIRQMAEAIEALHEAGFIHRDICPRNFICARDASWLKMIDFGLTVPDEAPYRMPGNRTGTPLYMAPEIVRRRNTDHRVDIFAFGITCFRLLTGEHPWSSGGDTTGNAALAHDSSPPKDLLELRPHTDPHLAAAVMKCIESQPEDRYPSMSEFLRDIKRVEHEDV